MRSIIQVSPDGQGNDYPLSDKTQSPEEQTGMLDRLTEAIHRERENIACNHSSSQKDR
jgi:hypothetical protein